MIEIALFLTITVQIIFIYIHYLAKDNKHISLVIRGSKISTNAGTDEKGGDDGILLFPVVAKDNTTEAQRHREVRSHSQHFCNLKKEDETQ